MKTILFTWNPDKWHWDNLAEAVIETNQTGKFYDEWSCGVNKSIKTGDRAFLLKLGKHPKGLIGSGFVTSDVFVAPHWNSELAQGGKKANKVDIEFDVLSETPIIDEAELISGELSSQNWFPQSSGIRIDEEIAQKLETIWQTKTRGNHISTIENISETYSEGRRIASFTYTYERNSEAREKCISIYGHRCFVCSVSFREAYGAIGENFIHIHHKRPLSEIREEYAVDPENDLVPICPNCHAMVHRKVPAMDVGDLKAVYENMRHQSSP